MLSISIEESTQEVEVRTRAADEFYDEIGRLAADGLSILEMDSPDNNLESVYEYLVAP